MSDRKTFMDLVIRGEAFLDDIDDHIDTWQSSDSDESLADFLGMTKAEYGLWVEQAAALRFIVRARIEGTELPFYDAVAKAAEPVGMRAPDVGEAEVILEWLRETGRIKT